MVRLPERTAFRLAVFSVLALALVWTMLPTAGYLNEFRDAQIITLHERAAVDAVRRFHELPLWDPWYCGGLYGLGTPQSRFASPLFLLSLLFGAERAEPLVIFLFAVLGMEGSFRWVRLRVDDAWAALRVAPFFAFSGHFAVAYFRGWTNFFGFELVPFVLLGVTLAARGRTSGIAISAVAFTVILGFGGTFAAPLVAVAVAIEASRALFEQPPSRRSRALFMLVALGSFMAAASAVRLLPIAETLAASPRIMAGTPGHSPKTILFELVRTLEVKGGDFDDVGQFYVGGAFLALVALGGSDRRSIVPLVIVVLFLWLSAGYARKPPLFALLRELPVFSALRYPERFLWIAILYASEPAANALAKLPRLGDGMRWRLGANVVLTLAVVITVGSQIATFIDVGKARELGVVQAGEPTPFHQARGNRWLAAHYQGVGAGSLSCWETHPVLMSPKLRGDLVAEEYLADPRLGTVRRIAWSPNRIVVAAALSSAGRLYVNQNWHPGWRASIGSVVPDDGLLAVDLPAGEHEVTLTFEPRSARAGAAMTATALVALGLLVFAARRGRAPFRRGAIATTTLLVAAPWAVLAAFVGTWSEPRYPLAPLRNANGSPALVAVPDANALPIGAQFAVPIAVDAIRVDGPNVLQNLEIDLWFRRTEAMPRTTALFVHVVRAPGQAPADEKKDGDPKDRLHSFFNADHQVVGGSFYLSDAPIGYLVHDAFGINVSKAARGDYEILVGFGHVSGRRGRAKVLEPGHATTSDDWIKIGSFSVR